MLRAWRPAPEQRLLIVCRHAPGASSRQIAATLIVPARTWDNLFHNARRKLGVTSRDEPARVLRWQPPGSATWPAPPEG